MSTFGNSTDYDDGWVALAVDKILGYVFTLSTPGVVSKLSAYVKGAGANQAVKGVVYAMDGAGGIPGTLKGTTAEVTIGSADVAAWKDLTFASAVSLVAGDYFLGLHHGATSNGAQWAIGGAVPGTRYYWSDTYADGPADPASSPGSGTPDSGSYAIYATYSPWTYGTGALTVASPGLAGLGTTPEAITGTGAVAMGAVVLLGAGHGPITGTGALTIASPTLSGSIWQDSAHLRHLGGKAMLWGAKGRAEIRGLKGKASM